MSRPMPLRADLGTWLRAATIVVVAAFALPSASAQPPSEGRSVEERIEELERKLREYEQRENDGLRPSLPGEPADDPRSPRYGFKALFDPDRLWIGGYGEIHFNFGEGSATDQADIHRLVVATQAQFNDWISLTSEIELEHAFVSEDDGELKIEQLQFNFAVDDNVSIVVGRYLVPIGLVNLRHEPVNFNGVERPLFSRVLVPATFFADGIGANGNVSPELSWQFFIGSGLDGSGFSSTSGIRGGRLQERPSLDEPSFSGRLEWFPFAERPAPHGQRLRVGLSGYFSGIDNGDQDASPGLDGDVTIAELDVEWSIGRFDFRGATAYEKIQGAREIGGNVATDIWGYFVEGAVHVLPESCRTGRLRHADLVLFSRFDLANLQEEVPSGLPSDPSGTIRETTVGASFFLNPQVVLKADVQFRDDRNPGDLPTLFNLGIGWIF